MKINCGTDIIEVERIKEAIDKLGDKFLNEIYTLNEIKYCEEKKINKYQHYAARFAGKEAVFKAVSNLLNSKFDLSWKDIEIINDNQGKPIVTINQEKIKKEIQIDISLSHIKDYAIAYCIVVEK